MSGKYKENILNKIIEDLGENYSETDKNILKDILDDTILNALRISHRRNNEDNIKTLIYEIKKCVKTIYLQRGTEDVSDLNESGKNSTYVDALDVLRRDIIKNGKRVIF